jgi:thiosulfate dehydrogenase [quinone] large subunit
MSYLDSSIIKNTCQLYGLITLRVLIGWHFLYEGISKLINPYWSSAAYLLDSKWIFSGLAKAIVANPTLLTISDYVNMWGLTLVGLSLMLGLFSRCGSLAGMTFICLYYLFAPPLLGLEYGRPGEGSYIIVNKNLIEAFALYVLYLFPSSQFIGLDRLINSSQSNSLGDK